MFVFPGTTTPDCWSPQPCFADGGPIPVLMVNLLASESEYQRVAHMFYSTGGWGNIISIERVQNLCLYKQYSTYRQEVERNNCRSGFNNQNERQLFHGTKGCNVRAINLQGFNRNFCGLNGKLPNWPALFEINCHGESHVWLHKEGNVQYFDTKPSTEKPVL